LTDHLPVPGPAAEPVGTAGPATGAAEATSAASTDSVIPAGKYDADLDRLFGAGGPLAPAVGTFKPRQAQTEMAKAVAHAIDNQQVLMAEAGTGTGKTFAYLVPALLWGGKTIVSTGTKNLQDQLFMRDIPTIRAALRAPVSVALLKGRSR
jgi:ATP-dependent DNA helicase DinG